MQRARLLGPLFSEFFPDRSSRVADLVYGFLQLIAAYAEVFSRVTNLVFFSIAILLRSGEPRLVRLSAMASSFVS